MPTLHVEADTVTEQNMDSADATGKRELCQARTGEQDFVTIHSLDVRPVRKLTALTKYT